jgi:hypothetical protein
MPILALLASAAHLPQGRRNTLIFEMEQVPRWLSPREKPRRQNAVCVAAMIR